MSTSLTSDFETPRASRRGKAEKVAFVAAKLVVTGACFWYVSRQIEWQQVWSAIPLLDFRWAGLASLLAMLEIPLVGLRWGNVVSALAARDQQPTWGHACRNRRVRSRIFTDYGRRWGRTTFPPSISNARVR